MEFKLYFSVFLVLTFYNHLDAQPSEKLVKVIVTPNHNDWTYEVGEQAEFNITALKNNIPLKGIEIKYIIQPDPGYRIIEIWDQGKFVLKSESTKIKAKKFDRPGFLRLTAIVEVDGKEYSSYATAGFSPENAQQPVAAPSTVFEGSADPRGTRGFESPEGSGTCAPGCALRAGPGGVSACLGRIPRGTPPVAGAPVDD